MDGSVQDFAWTEALYTDITSIDQQHQQLAYKLENIKLFQTIDPLPIYVFDTYQELIHDIESHFEYEEMVLRNIGYGDYERHAHVHNLILNELFAIEKSVILPKDTSQLAEAIKFVERTIVDHLYGEDLKIRKHLHTKPA